MKKVFAILTSCLTLISCISGIIPYAVKPMVSIAESQVFEGWEYEVIDGNIKMKVIFITHPDRCDIQLADLLLAVSLRKAHLLKKLDDRLCILGDDLWIKCCDLHSTSSFFYSLTGALILDMLAKIKRKSRR